MGLDDMIEKGKEMLAGHGDQVDEAIDKGAEAIKEKTPDQVDGVVDTVAEKAKDIL